MFGKKKTSLIGIYKDKLFGGLSALNIFAKRRRKARFIKIANYTVWTVVVIVMFLFANILIGWSSYAGLHRNSSAARVYLDQAVRSFAEGEYDEAGRLSSMARQSFEAGLEDLKNLDRLPASWLPPVNSRIDTGLDLMTIGLSISAVAESGLSQSKQFFELMPTDANFDFNQMSSETKGRLLARAVQSTDQLSDAKESLAYAGDKLKRLDDDLLKAYDIDKAALADKLQQAVDRVDEALVLSRVLPPLAGYPEEARYLFVLQNSDELRPTGGFIGTFGTAKVKNGEIAHLETSDVYHLDMPVRDKLQKQPPEPIARYLGVDKWYLRDANWSPDWPTSARNILDSYRIETELNPDVEGLRDIDFITAINPAFIIDLLELTGPIEAGGEEYTSGNFVDLLQRETSIDFEDRGVRHWDRKGVIGELTQKMRQRLLTDLGNNWRQVVTIVEKHLERKNILFYAVDNDELNSMLKNEGIWGQVRQSPGDYLMLVDANMAALKTDNVINRLISYTLKDESGALKATVDISYAHNGNFDWRTTRYLSYTRLYVPKGSRLLQASGFQGDVNDVKISEELGKTYFGVYIKVEPGQIGHLSFTYELPYNLYELYKLGQYDLLVQKQPGSRIDDLEVDLKFKRQVADHGPASLQSAVNGSRVRWQTDFLSDKLFEVNF